MPAFTAVHAKTTIQSGLIQCFDDVMHDTMHLLSRDRNHPIPWF